MNRSDYTYEQHLVDVVMQNGQTERIGVFCIVDLDLGNCSVTNDMENVVADIIKEADDFDPFVPIAYCDSDEQWSLVGIVSISRQGGISIKFIPGTTTDSLEDVLAKAATRYKWMTQNDQHRFELAGKEYTFSHRALLKLNFQQAFKSPWDQHH